MNEEEKERIEHLIERCNECKLNACITCDICWSEVQAIDKLYNLIEKQQAEIEDLQKSVEQIYDDYQDAGKKMFDYAEEVEKKDKIINKMAERLTAPYYGKEDVIDYYKREVEK